MKIQNSEESYKIIRDGNEEPSKRTRPVYSGIVEAILYECEQKISLTNQRFIDDFLV